VDLEIFNLLAGGPMTSDAVASKLGTDPRGTTILLDALSALELLAKSEDRYSLPVNVADVLTDGGAHSVLPMVQHQANCLRRWSRLSWVVKTGVPQREPSVRGADADTDSFIKAMHVLSGPTAETVVGRLGTLSFSHLLDVGGASGTWVIAFLRANPTATATIFDLPSVIPMARQRMAEAGLDNRVTLVPGDFYVDPLPIGADFIWLSAIAHQNSREQNRVLFGKIHNALTTGGTLVIRDIVMEDDHVNPPGGAMFAVNMLAGTDGGSTYSLGEYCEDLETGGFGHVQLVYRDVWMNSLVRATRP
jgi:hypothetical protein